MTKQLPPPFPGRLAYLARGPLVAPGEWDSVDPILEAVHEFAREEGVRYLVLQPPICGMGRSLEATLESRGFHPSLLDAAQPVATARIDLSSSTDAIFANMRSNTRRNIRKAMRAGVTVREGRDDDLDTFYELWRATALRQNFRPLPYSYIRALWVALAPLGFLRLFIAEVGGRPVSAELVIPFNDTVLAKLVGWSGEHRESRPNELLKWEVIKWSKRSGYRYYDVEDIDIGVARVVSEGRGIPKEYVNSVDSFKLGFGGEVMFMPKPFDYAYGKLLRRTIHSRFGRWSLQHPRLRRAAHALARRAR